MSDKREIYFLNSIYYCIRRKVSWPSETKDLFSHSSLKQISFEEMMSSHVLLRCRHLVFHIRRHFFHCIIMHCNLRVSLNFLQSKRFEYRDRLSLSITIELCIQQFIVTFIYIIFCPHFFFQLLLKIPLQGQVNGRLYSAIRLDYRR